METEPTLRELVAYIRNAEKVSKIRDKRLLDKIESLGKELSARMDGGDRAVKVYEEQMQQWKQGHNEWRKSLEDSRSDTMSRNELNGKFAAFTERLDGHEKIINENRGKSIGVNAVWVVLIGIAGLIIAALSVVVVVIKK